MQVSYSCRKVILVLSFLILMRIPAWAQENQDKEVAKKPLSKEEMEIIKNMELLQNLDIFQNEDTNLLENYDDLGKSYGDEGGSNGNKTDQ